MWPQAQSSDLLVNNAVPAGVYELHAGDPVQRALAAWSLEQALLRPDKVTVTGAWDDMLLDTLLVDDYPAVRRFASNALQASDTTSWSQHLLTAFDFMADTAQRRQQLATLLANREQHDVESAQQRFNLDPALMVHLKKLGKLKSEGIDVGE